MAGIEHKYTALDRTKVLKVDSSKAKMDIDRCADRVTGLTGEICELEYQRPRVWGIIYEQIGKNQVTRNKLEFALCR